MKTWVDVLDTALTLVIVGGILFQCVLDERRK